MRKHISSILVALLILLPGYLSASHVSGAYFSFSCISGNTYNVTFTFWRDCSGASAPTTFNMNVTSSCGNYGSVNLTQSGVGAVEVSQLCPTQLSQSSCQNGTLPGYQQYVYSGQITLNPNCTNWNFSTGISARNPSTNLLGQSYAYFNASLTDPTLCNNSPVFTSQPIPYYCTNQQVQFNPGVVEADGDSLVYSLITPLTTGGGTATFNGGYTAANPFGVGTTTLFDPNTGQLSFTPTSVGNYVLAYEVCEYRNGTLLGCVTREFQMVIQACNNMTPVMPTGIQNFIGSGGSIIDSNSLLVCIGDTLSFDVYFTDSLIQNQLIGDSIIITTNAATSLSGSLVSVVNGNPALLHIEWVTTATSPPFNNFIVQVQDDACPIPGLAVFQFDITVVQPVDAGPDRIICQNGDSAAIMINTEDTLLWSLLSGDPLVMGSTISDTTGLQGDSIWLRPHYNSSYMVQTRYGSFCNYFDTISVDVRTLDIGADTFLCRGDTLTMGLDMIGDTPCSNGNASYSWSPSIGLSDSTLRNPLLTVLPGQATTQYILTFDDSCGCVLYDTVNININQMAFPNVSITKMNCGDVDGEIAITPQNGFAPYEYSIDTGQTYYQTNVFDSLPIGYYGIIVRDSMGCYSPLVYDTILDNNAPVVDSIGYQNALCFSSNSGYIQVYASGGTQPLQYTVDSAQTYQSSSLFTGLLTNDYWVAAVDTIGCQSIPEMIHIEQPPELILNLEVTHDTCFQACGGSSVAHVSGGIPPYTYNWFGYGANDTSSFNLCSGAYNFSVVDSHNCIVDTIFYVFEPAELVFDSIDVKHVTCFDGTDGAIGLYVSGGIPPYRYSIDGGQSTQASPYFTSLVDSVYEVQVFDSGYSCMLSTTIHLNEPSKTVVETPFNTTEICVSTCLNLTASGSGGNGAPYTYHWSAGNVVDPSTVSVCPTSDSLYTVYVTDSEGCASDVELVRVQLYDSLKVEVPNLAAICVGDSVEVTAIPSGGNPNSGYSFNWTPQYQISDPYSQTVMLYPERTTNYVVQLNDGCGSPAVFDTITINSLPDPVPEFIDLLPRTGCELKYVEFQNTTDSALYVQWILGGEYEGNGFGFNVDELEEGSYDLYVRVEDFHGCVGENTWENYVIVNPSPVADFIMDPNPTTIFKPTVHFTNHSYNGNILNYTWDFAGLDSSFLNSPTYEFPQDTGTYPVTLTAETDSGCIASVTKLLYIGPEYNFYIPNSFTPNEDALNDEYKPYGIGLDVKDYSFKIYDRWGQLVFETHRVDEGWDGSILNSNGDSNLGVYVWVIELRDLTDTEEIKTYRGKVNLIK